MFSLSKFTLLYKEKKRKNGYCSRNKRMAYWFNLNSFATKFYLNDNLPSLTKKVISQKHFMSYWVVRSTVEHFQIPYGTMDHISQQQFNGDNNLDNSQKFENGKIFHIDTGFPYLVNPRQVDSFWKRMNWRRKILGGNFALYF